MIELWSVLIKLHRFLKLVNGMKLFNFGLVLDKTKRSLQSYR